MTCKAAMNKGFCMGCGKLELREWNINTHCKEVSIPTAKESLERIYKNLGIKRK